jgi:molecular chaperone GrpE
MSDENSEPSSDAVERALKSVEQLDAEPPSSGDDDLDPDAIEVLSTDPDLPPSGDPSGEGHAADPELEQAFANAAESELEAEATGEFAAQADLDDDSDGDEEEIVVEDEPKKPDPKDAMLEAMITAKQELTSVLDQTQKEAKSLHDRLVRVTADYENFKKRQNREKDEALKFANEKLLKELLPVIDNMERAADVARKAAEEAEGDVVKGVVEGVEMVHKSFMDTFKKFGIESFTAMGEVFDPAKHEAVAQREDASVPSNTVIEEYQRGYMLHDRLVRPSMVIVSSGGPAAGAPASDEETSSQDGENGEEGGA